MKWKFTYKELTLLIGILVAVIIMITLWFKPSQTASGEVSIKPVKQIAAPAVKIALKNLDVVAVDLMN